MTHSDGKNLKQKRVVLWFGLGLGLILAFGLHDFCTRNWGVGVSHDSIFYLSSASSFLEGEGFKWVGGGGIAKPLTHFPPLYPLSLAISSIFTGDVNLGANWVASLFFAVNALVVFWLVYLGTKSYKTSSLAMLFFIFSPMILDVHFEALSEPVYLTFSFMSLGFLSIYSLHNKRSFLIAAGLTAACAYLTRYVGISIIFTGVVYLFFVTPGSRRIKLKSAVSYAVIGLIPILGWYLRNYFLTGSFTNRVLAFHFVTTTHIRDAMQTMSNWILPEKLGLDPSIGLVVLLVVSVLYGIWFKNARGLESENKDEREKSHRFFIILQLYIIFYLSSLLVSITFFDSSTRLQNRILIPLYVSSLLLLFIVIHRVVSFSKKENRYVIMLVSLLFLSLLMVLNLSQSRELIQKIRQDGRGFGSAAWRKSEIVAGINQMGTDAIIYSNEASALYYLTGIGVYSIPEKFDPVRDQVRDRYATSMLEMRQQLAQPESALAIFHQGYLREGLPSLEEMTEGLVIAHESHDGVIFVDPNNIKIWKKK
jgi:4-amino-4-deoxy-L-arabinose transferase-like glycosyltransferase